MQVRTRILNTTLGVTAALALVASQSTGTALSAQATLCDVIATPAVRHAAVSASRPTATISGSAAVGKKLTAKTGS